MPPHWDRPAFANHLFEGAFFTCSWFARAEMVSGRAELQLLAHAGFVFFVLNILLPLALLQKVSAQCWRQSCTQLQAPSVSHSVSVFCVRPRDSPIISAHVFELQSTDTWPSGEHYSEGGGNMLTCRKITSQQVLLTFMVMWS